MKIAIYTRISKDRVKDKEVEEYAEGVKRQEKICRAYAKDRDWEVVNVFSDNDITAYRGKKKRPGFEALKVAMRNNEFDAVLAWHSDRLYRSLKDLEKYIDASIESDIPTYTVAAGHYDLTNPASQMTARLITIVAQYEIDHLIERMRAKKKERRENGFLLGKGRAFGWERSEVSGIPQLVPKEAARVVQMFHDFPDKSARQIGRDLNAEGFVTVEGKQFSPTAVRRVLRNPTHCGLIEYGWTTMKADEKGDVIEGNWDGIIDVDTWMKTRELLTTRSLSATFMRSEHTTLLSSLMTCGECGAIVHKHDDPRRGKVVYSPAGCRHVMINADKADPYIVGLLLPHLRESATMQNVSNLREQRKAIADRLTSLTEMFTDGSIDASQFQQASKRLQADKTNVDTQLVALSDITESFGTLEWWDSLPLTDQRKLIQANMLIKTHKSTRPGNKFRPMEERLSVEFVR